MATRALKADLLPPQGGGRVLGDLTGPSTSSGHPRAEPAPASCATLRPVQRAKLLLWSILWVSACGRAPPGRADLLFMESQSRWALGAMTCPGRGWGDLGVWSWTPPVGTALPAAPLTEG